MGTEAKSDALEDDGNALATADAGGADCVLFVEAVQAVRQVGNDSCARCAQRVSESWFQSVSVSQRYLLLS